MCTSSDHIIPYTYLARDPLFLRTSVGLVFSINHKLTDLSGERKFIFVEPGSLPGIVLEFCSQR